MFTFWKKTKLNYDLPEIKSTFIKTVKRNPILPTVDIRAWTNRQIIQYTTQIEELGEVWIDDATEEENKGRITQEELSTHKKIYQWQYIIEPNILKAPEGYNFNPAQRDALLVELYSLSRSSVIYGLRSKCTNCGIKNEMEFDLKKDVTYRELISAPITVGEYVFEIESSNDYTTVVKNTTLDAASYLLRYVKSFTKKGEQFAYETKDEFVKWALDEMEEGEFGLLISELSARVPATLWKKDVFCMGCEEVFEVRFEGMPGF